MNIFRGEREPPGPPSQSGEVCRNFQKGRCKWGSQCMHIHVNGADPRQGVREKGDFPQPRPPRPNGKLLPELYKTEVCKNFLQGQCTYGDNCWFKHSEDDQNRQPPTKPPDEFEVCRKYIKGDCTRGESCWYVHVEPQELMRSPGMPEELKQKKLQICRKFAKGKCDRADACWFIHAASVLNRRKPSDVRPESQPVDPAERANEVCRRFLKGTCTRGDRCWYKHTESMPGEANVQPYNANPPPQLSNPAQENMPINYSNTDAFSQILQQVNPSRVAAMPNGQQNQQQQEWQSQQQPQLQSIQRDVLPLNSLEMNQAQAQGSGQDSNAGSQTGPNQSWIPQLQNNANAQPDQREQDQMLNQLQQIQQQEAPQLNARPPTQVSMASVPIENQDQYSQQRIQAAQAQQSLHMLLHSLQSKSTAATTATGQVVQQTQANSINLTNSNEGNEAISRERSDTLGRRRREDFDIPVMNALPEQKKTRTDVQPIGGGVPRGMSQPHPSMNSLPIASRPDQAAHGAVNLGSVPVGTPSHNTTAATVSSPMMVPPGGGSVPVPYLTNQTTTMQGAPVPTSGPASQGLDSQQQNICY